MRLLTLTNYKVLTFEDQFRVENSKLLNWSHQALSIADLAGNANEALWKLKLNSVSLQQINRRSKSSQRIKIIYYQKFRLISNNWSNNSATLKLLQVISEKTKNCIMVWITILFDKFQ